MQKIKHATLNGTDWGTASGKNIKKLINPE
jgi:hypothetical protein